MKHNDDTQKLPFRTKLGYGMAELSSSLTWTMVAVCFLVFLIDVVGLHPAFAGFVLMVGKLWDAITDPLMGVISDRSRTRWGRRRPFLLSVAIPYGLITWLLFSDFGLGSTLTKVYFIIAIVMYNTASTILEVPYTSLAAEMTQDYDERTRLFSFRAVFSQVASIIASAVPWTLAPFLSELLGGEERTGWSAMAALFGVFAIIPILWTWNATRGYELYPEHTTVKLRDVLEGPLKNRTFLYTMAIYATSSMIIGAVGTVMEMYMKHYMGFTGTQQTLAFVFLFACTVLWIPLVSKVSTTYGKRESFICFFGIWIIVQLVGVAVMKPAMVIPFYVLMVLASGGVVTITLVGMSMIPDAVEVDEFKTGQRREGLNVGVMWFFRKLGIALIIQILGLVLWWIGYDGSMEVQAPQTISGIRILFIVGPAILMFVSMIFAYLLPMTRQRHLALKKAIQLKKDGKPWDEASLKGLL
jgi:sugar (glycoside-pentoside-hexuronide) transporter